MLKKILTEMFDHARVPYQVAFKYSGRWKALEEIRLQGSSSVIFIVKAFHEFTLATRDIRGVESICLRGYHIAPAHFAARQTALIIGCEPLSMHDGAPSVGGVVVDCESVHSNRRILDSDALRQLPILFGQAFCCRS